MIGRVYRWRGGHWRVLCRWAGKGPRNVLIERVEMHAVTVTPGCDDWIGTGERVIRPFRGLRKVRADFAGGPKV